MNLTTHICVGCLSQLKCDGNVPRISLCIFAKFQVEQACSHQEEVENSEVVAMREFLQPLQHSRPADSVSWGQLQGLLMISDAQPARIWLLS